MRMRGYDPDLISPLTKICFTEILNLIKFLCLCNWSLLLQELWIASFLQSCSSFSMMGKFTIYFTTLLRGRKTRKNRKYDINSSTIETITCYEFYWFENMFDLYVAECFSVVLFWWCNLCFGCIFYMVFCYGYIKTKTKKSVRKKMQKT